MPVKKRSSTRITRANPKGTKVSSIKPLTLVPSQEGPKASKKKGVDKTLHVVTPSKTSPIEVETVEEDEDDDDIIQPKKPAKKAKNSNPQSRPAKQVQVRPLQAKKAPVVRPLRPKKSRAATKKKTVIPTDKAQEVMLNKSKKILAVMNVKTGAATIFKTPKQVTAFFTQMNSLGGTEDLKSCVFENEKHFLNTSETYKKNDEPSTPISTRTAGIPLAASILVSPNKKGSPLSAAVSKQYARLNKPAAASNKLASHLQQKLAGLNGTSLKLLLFPETVCVTDNEKYQVFAIDLVENKTDCTVWTHKPDAWSKLFQMDEELAVEDGGHAIEPFFYSLQATCPRSVAKGPNLKKQLHTKNGKTVDCQLLWGMIKCTPDTQAKLQLELVKFSTLASDKEIQQAYFVAVQTMGTNYPALLDQVRPTDSSKPRFGEYWTKLNSSCTSPIKIVHHTSMDEVFQDDVIGTAVSFIWEAGGQSTSMWSGEMNMFAYGRT